MWYHCCFFFEWRTLAPRFWMWLVPRYECSSVSGTSHAAGTFLLLSVGGQENMSPNIGWKWLYWYWGILHRSKIMTLFNHLKSALSLNIEALYENPVCAFMLFTASDCPAHPIMISQWNLILFSLQVNLGSFSSDSHLWNFSLLRGFIFSDNKGLEALTFFHHWLLSVIIHPARSLRFQFTNYMV